MQERQRIGETLRAARLAKGVSLEEAAAATRIRRSALQALEADDADALPASVYTRGFLINYARYLGLLADELVEEFDRQERERAEPPALGGQEDQVRKSSFLSPKLLWALLLIIALGVILNFVYQEFLSAGPPPAAAPQAEATPTSVPSPVVELPPLRTPTVEPTPSPTPTPVPTPITGVNVTLRSTTQEVWIQVTADDTVVYVGIIGPETDQGTEPLTWNADQSVLITFGRTGGVEMIVNERELAPLAESQDPVLFEAIETADGELQITVNGDPVSPP